MIFTKRISYAALVIGLVVVSFVIGRLSHREHVEPEPDSVAGAASRAPASKTVPGESADAIHLKVYELQKENQALREKVSGLSKQTPDKLPGKVNSPQELLEKRAVPLFNENYGLNEEIAEALGLAESEYIAVTQTLTDTLSEIDAIRESSIEVRQQSDSQLFLKIPSFREQGAELQSSLEEGLRQQLGDERYSSFMLMAGDALNGEYYQFGKAFQTISVKTYTSQNTGAERIRIVDEVHIPQGDGTKTVIQTKDNYDALPDRYRSYFDVVDTAQ